MKREVKVGFTGRRDSLSEAQAKNLLVLLRNNAHLTFEAHHGDCVGADAFFAQSCLNIDRDIRIICHPPENESLRAFTHAHETRQPLPYLKRNQNIVDETHLLIACPATMEEITRSGTWMTVRHAKKTGKDIFFCYPDGSWDMFQHGKAFLKKRLQ